MNASQETSSILPTYARAPVAFERGEGAWLEATDGSRYLDFGAGIAVAVLGYSHPHLVNALIEQGQKLWHVSNLFRIPQAEALGAKLTQATFADYVFFANSGAEALEGTRKEIAALGVNAFAQSCDVGDPAAFTGFLEAARAALPVVVGPAPGGAVAPPMATSAASGQRAAPPALR